MLTRCFARKTGVTSKKILAAHLLSVLPATYCTSQCNLTSVYQILSPKFFQKKPLLAFSKKILPFNTQSFEEKLVINRIFLFDLQIIVRILVNRWEINDNNSMSNNSSKGQNSNYFWGAQGFEFYARQVQWEPTRTTTAEFQ